MTIDIQNSMILDAVLKNTIHNPIYFLCILVFLAVLYITWTCIYNAYLHPLSQYPGPKLAAATRLYYIYYSLTGTAVHKIHILHNLHGPIVRIAPDELSYIHPDAWNAIYGHRSAGKTELQKDPGFYGSTSLSEGSLLDAGRVRHGELRKMLSNGFSERSLRGQEGIVRSYADLFIEKLGEHGGKGVDMTKWFNFFTFDVMGDLVFGESFGCLASSDYHTWISFIFSAIKCGPYMRATRLIPALRYLAPFFIPKSIFRGLHYHQQISISKAKNRQSHGANDHDLISGFMKPGGDVTWQEFLGTSQLLIVAGSETTATLMSGATFLLLTNPEKMGKSVREIRGAFESLHQITLASVSKLEYLHAVLQEAMRVYPPVPDSLPRNTGENSEIICGKLVPPHTILGVTQWAAHHSANNFSRADEFIPERWLGEDEFKDDKQSVMQPFSAGPRICLGRTLAYFEMRLLMTLLLWHFDLELMDESKCWIEQKIFTLWEKGPLMVKMSPRKV